MAISVTRNCHALSHNLQGLAFKLSCTLRYLHLMVQERADHFTDATPIPEIEALLAMSQTMSIVDRLMAMPRTETDVAREWDKAVSTRLQAKVSGMMRDCLARPQDCRAAA